MEKGLGPVKAEGKSASIARRAGPQESCRRGLQQQQTCIAPMQAATDYCQAELENHSPGK
jgi:hypothetical protein